MKPLFRTWVIALLVFAGVLYSCSDEDYQSLDNLSTDTGVEYRDALDFVAALSPQQQENFDLLLPKVTYGFARSKLHHELEAAVHWDLLNIVMLDSFAAFRPPAFYARLKTVYLAGHFPCGVTDPDMTQTDLITLMVY